MLKPNEKTQITIKINGVGHMVTNKLEIEGNERYAIPLMATALVQNPQLIELFMESMKLISEGIDKIEEENNE